MPHDRRGFLHDAIPDIIADDLLYKSASPPNFSAWRDEVGDIAHENAESRVVYTSDEERVIEEYETHEYAPDTDDIDQSGTTYSASGWREARSAYAYAIAAAVLERLLSDAIDLIEENADLLPVVAARLGADPDEAEEALTVSRDNPHGWAAHSSEGEDEETGLYYYAFTHGQLDGLNGVVSQVEGVWLSIVWSPTTKEEKPA